MKHILSTLSLLFLGLIVVSPGALAQTPHTHNHDEHHSYVGIGVQMKPWLSSGEGGSLVISFVTLSGFICDGPADRIELKNLDIVTSIDGKVVGGDRLTMKGLDELLSTITSGNVGDPVVLVIDSSMNSSDEVLREVTILREKFMNPEFSKNCDE